MENRDTTQKELINDLVLLGRKIAEMEKSRLAFKSIEEELSQANTKLQILQQVTEAVHSYLDLEKVFQEITDRTVHSLGYTTAFILALDNQKRCFETRALSSRKRLLPQINKVLGFPLKNFSFSLDSELNPVIKTVMKGKIVVTKSLEELAYPLIKKKTCSALQQLGGTKNYIAVPLKGEKEVVGGLVISNSWEDVSQEEIAFLKTFAHAASSAIKNANLHKQTKEAEEDIKTSEERLKILFEFAPDAYYLNDLKGNFIDGNRAAEEITGYKREELIGKSFLKLKLLPPEQIKKAAALLVKNALGSPTGPDEFILNRKDGQKVPVEIRTVPVKIRGQTQILGIAHDITERKKAEEKIKTSLEEKEVLLREIHHRVNNNMQIMSSLLRLQTAKIDNEMIRTTVREYLNRLRSMALIHEKLYQSDDLARINFARYIRSLIVHIFQTFNVGTKIIKIKTDMKDVFLDITTAIPCGLIVNELISNSLKHAFPGGRTGEIGIKLRQGKNNKLVLFVSDNGVGLPRDINFRNSSALGLQLVNDLVRQIGGTVRLDRKDGTEFRIAI